MKNEEKKIEPLGKKVKPTLIKKIWKFIFKFFLYNLILFCLLYYFAHRWMLYTHILVFMLILVRFYMKESYATFGIGLRQDMTPMLNDKEGMTRFVCLSDSHGKQDEIMKYIPEGDVLVYCGDFSHRYGEYSEAVNFFNWIVRVKKTKNFKHVVIVCGNHDLCMDGDKKQELEELFRSKTEENIHYLVNQMVVVNGIKVFGTPFSNQHYPNQKRWVYQIYDETEECKRFCQEIPDCDVLLTHGPPLGILDKVFFTRGNAGCKTLRKRIEKIKPKFHVFGHIHEGYGWKKIKETTFVNASILSILYKPGRTAMMFDV